MLLNLFFYLTVFLFGLVVGSFLNCVIYRLESDRGFLFGRSSCPHCKHILKVKDLIPLLSFLILKGKCRYCSQKISWQYPLVEFSTGVLSVLIANQQLTIGSQQLTILSIINACFLFLVFCFLIIIFVYDLKHYIIPDKVIYPAIGITFIYNSIFNWLYGSMTLWLYGLGVAFFASAFFISIVLISGGKWMGLGDVKLAFLLGFFLGFPNILIALFFAFSIGAIIGMGLVISGKKTLKSEVPFAPFLVAGAFFAVFFGQQLMNFLW